MLHAFATLGALTGAPLPAAMAAQLYRPADISEESAMFRVSDHTVRARRYVARGPKAASGRGVLLLHGVHALGIDEPRLVSFARTLARAGLDVLTPELTQLTVYRLEPQTIADIRALAAAHAQATHAEAVGVIGISFAGGLALMAAAEQEAAADGGGVLERHARPIGFVTTVGAHDDLTRLCHYYAGETVRGPNGEPTNVAPHPYGARVMLRQQLGRFVTAADLPVATHALDSYLHDQPREAKRLSEQLSAPGQVFMAVVLEPGVSKTLAGFLDIVARAQHAQLMAASPHGHLSALHVPVFLLHGEADPIIPSIETAYLAREVPKRWLRAVVITPLLRHAEFPEPPTPRQAWDLARFVRLLLEQAGSLKLREY
ncbi:MAG: hypothetical protein RL701_1151 [Pseudomonadota bacterium]